MRIYFLMFSIALTACGADSRLTAWFKGSGEKKSMIIVAHRGHKAAAPENTLAAFSKAIDVRSDLIELDYHHTADGIPYILHDETLDRTTNARTLWGGQGMRIDDTDSKKLSGLDAGGWYSQQFAGEKIPTLEEALDLIQGKGGKTLIEHKAGDATTCAKLLQRKGYTQQVVVQSFDWKFLTELKNLNPNIETAALGGDAITSSVIADVLATGATTLSWKSSLLDARTVRTLHERGLSVHGYAVNSDKELRRMRAIGVDGIHTDNPEYARTFLGED